MKVIDWKKGGEFAIRLYLGRDDLEEWWGDDWDDAPWQHNAGPVYDGFITSHLDIVLPEGAEVWEPGDISSENTYLSKEQIVERGLPVIIDFLGICYNYDDALRNKNTVKIFIGTSLSFGEIGKEVESA